MRKIFNNPANKMLGSAVILSSLALMPLKSIAATSNIQYLDQGSQWNKGERTSFYSQDQGSQIMPLKWMQALTQKNGKPFLADNLTRYGYLPNPDSPVAGLPVGFTTNDDNIGMTCSACHTRQITVNGTEYRIDGGPAITDFQTFASDLDETVNRTLNNKKTFDTFAKAVLGRSANEGDIQQLKLDLQTWYLPYHTLMNKALPKKNPWGPARLDAVGMIFGRLTGLDIGTSANHIIASNIRVADAPVRYPFLWNASIQDITQWPGFADNGNDLLALSRNLGEVIGVFNHFYPQEDKWRILGIDYLKVNSANFTGLKKLEDSIKRIGPPKWPWAVEPNLVSQGKTIYESTTKTEDGGCITCHGIKKGELRPDPLPHDTWATPLCDVGTDTREITNIGGWKVKTGVLAGKKVPFLTQPLKAEDENAISVLGLAVLGSIIQHSLPDVIKAEDDARRELQKVDKFLGTNSEEKVRAIVAKLVSKQADLITKENASLKGAFRQMKDLSDAKKDKSAVQSNCKAAFNDPAPVMAYESRVLQGIWATAPYLHNGSVPTLDDLLKPASQRPTSFKIGPNYDLDKIGLAAKQTKFEYKLKTTDCNDLNSGNSRCGHEYGTKLTASEKKALLEYLKTL